MWLFGLFVAVPLIEIALFITVGGWLTLWPTLAIVVLTAVIGSWVVRRQGAAALAELQRAMSDLRDPGRPLDRPDRCALADGAGYGGDRRRRAAALRLARDARADGGVGAGRPAAGRAAIYLAAEEQRVAGRGHVQRPHRVVLARHLAVLNPLHAADAHDLADVGQIRFRLNCEEPVGVVQ